MLETSNYIDGQQAKELKELCKNYDKAKAEFERAKAEFDKIKDGIKALCPEKLNETADYIVKMKVTADYYTVDTKQIKEKYPEIAEECQTLKKGNVQILEILKK